MLRCPISLISNGWVHVLEDSEISLLLMVACGLGRLQLEDGAVAIPPLCAHFTMESAGTRSGPPAALLGAASPHSVSVSHLT